jgi:inosine-uridine nucleoside N-ribohydrolase
MEKVVIVLSLIIAVIIPGLPDFNGAYYNGPGSLKRNMSFVDNCREKIGEDKPIKIILDSDIGQDCDDAAAMALLHKFADYGEVEILATMFPMQDPMGAPAMDVINTYYGRPDIPIGTYKGTYQYLGKLWDHYNTKLAQNFPHDLKHGNDAPDAVALYRKILAKQPDESVVIVAVGPERLLADLLVTGPDAYSKLNGRDLIKKKVKLLSLMGAGFPKDQEWNIKIAPDAAKLVADTWPTPVVYSGNEIGKAIRTGRRLLTETPATNPVRASFENHPFVDKNTKDRESWDQTALLYAVRGAMDIWKVESKGYNFIDEAGRNEWRQDDDKDHSYLILNKPATVAQKIIEDLMVAPPAQTN